MSDYGHATVTKPRLPIGPFNVVCWILGVVSVFYVLFVFQSLFGVVPGIAFLLLGWPVAGAGSVPRWVYIQWSRYRDSRQDGGYLQRRSALLEQQRKGADASLWDAYQIVHMSFLDKGGEIRKLAFAWTPDNNYLTVLYRIEGMPLGYMNGNSDMKLAHQGSLMHLLSLSLQSAPPGTTHYGLTTLVYPADQAATNELLHRRGNPDVVEALGGDYPSDFIDPSDEQLANDIVQGVDDVHQGNIAAEPLTFAFLRVPWPRKMGKRLKLDDAQAFTASATLRLINRYFNALDQAGLGPSFMSQFEITQTLLHLRCVRDLSRFQQRATYDQVMVEQGQVDSLDETTSAQLDFTKPVSTRYDRSGQLIVDGTGIMVGFVDEVHQTHLSPSDKEMLFDFSPGTWWTYTMYGFVMGAGSRRKQGKRKENLVYALTKLDESISGPVSNPEGDQWMQTVQDQRAVLATAGSRTATWTNVLSVRSEDPEDTPGIMEEVADRLRSTFEIRPVFTKGEILDLVLSHAGIKSDK